MLPQRWLTRRLSLDFVSKINPAVRNFSISLSIAFCHSRAWFLFFSLTGFFFLFMLNLWMDMPSGISDISFGDHANTSKNSRSRDINFSLMLVSSPFPIFKSFSLLPITSSTYSVSSTGSPMGSVKLFLNFSISMFTIIMQTSFPFPFSWLWSTYFSSSTYMSRNVLTSTNNP